MVRKYITLEDFVLKHCFIGSKGGETTFNSSKDIIDGVKEWLKEQDPEATAWALRNKIITEE